MDPRFQPVDGIDWLAAARRLRRAALMVFAALVLALASAGAWLHTGYGALLILAQIAAAGAALLRFREAVLETRLVFVAGQYINARWLDVRREDIRQLRRRLRHAMKLALWAWPVALGMASLPFVMDLPGKIPGSERIYAIAMLLFVIHWAVSEIEYRHLANALVESRDFDRVCVLPV